MPFVGKRWVHQISSYDEVRGISYWTKNYRTSIEATVGTGDEHEGSVECGHVRNAFS